MATEIDKIEAELKVQDDPIILASYLTRLAGWTSYYTEQLKRIIVPKAGIWLELKVFKHPDEPYGKPLSDKHTDMIWASMENGQKEIALTYELKRLDVMYKGISKRLWTIEQEFKKLNV